MISMLSNRAHARKPVPYTCRMTTRDRIQRSFMTLTPAGRQVLYDTLTLVGRGTGPTPKQERKELDHNPSGKTGMRLSHQQEDRYETLTSAGRQV
jgi:hypothetical protein